MRFTVLGSGSTGNAVLISSDKTNVLVDAGMSSREILRRLAEVGVSHDSLDGVLITHEHGVGQLPCIYVKGNRGCVLRYSGRRAEWR